MLAESGIYAIRACEILAQLDDNSVFPTRKISEELDLSNQYLVKVLQKLKQAGIVKSQKGAGGGVQLNIDPGKIKLYQIVEASNPSFLDHLDPSGIEDLKDKHNKLYLILNRHMVDVQKFLKETTLKNFIDYRSGGQL